MPERINAVLAKPEDNRQHPAVRLLHHCGGFSANVAEEWPAYLKTQGYVVLAVDTFGSRGYGICPNGMDKDFARFVRDAYGARDWLAAQPYVDRNRIAVMGFSHGAIAINSVMVRWRVRANAADNFKAAIALYGSCRDIGIYPDGSLPLLEIVGEKDEEFAESCRRAAAHTSGRIEVEILPGAYHAFDNAEFSGRSDPYGHAMYFSREATERARELVRDFLARRLKPL